MKIRIRSSDRTVREEYCLALLSLYPVIYTPIIYLASYTIDSIIGSFIKYGLYIYAGLLALNCSRRIIRSIRLNTVVFILWFLFQYVLQLIIHNDHNEFYIHLMMQTAICFLWFFAVSSINDYMVFYRSLKVIAQIAFVATILFLLRNGVNSYRLESGVSYNQALSYCFIIAPIIFTIELVKKVNMLNVVFLIISIIVALLLGTRGVFVCIAICAVLCIFTMPAYRVNLLKLNKLLIVFGIIAVGIIVSVFFDSIMNLILVLEEYIGGNGRIINKILNSAFYYSEGRNYIWDAALKTIRENVLFGVGMGTDRLYLRDTLNASDTVYCHNFILELLLQYGVIVGIPLLFVFFYHLAKVFKVCKTDINLHTSYICVLCIGFVPLLMSSSYLQWPAYYVLVGFIFSVRSRYRF